MSGFPFPSLILHIYSLHSPPVYLPTKSLQHTSLVQFNLIECYKISDRHAPNMSHLFISFWNRSSTDHYSICFFLSFFFRITSSFQLLFLHLFHLPGPFLPSFHRFTIVNTFKHFDWFYVTSPRKISRKESVIFIIF